MRRSPGHHASLLGPAEQFFDIPLTTEPVHNPARAPEVSIRTQHPPTLPGILQLATQRRIHMPAQGWPLVASVELRWDWERRERLEASPATACRCGLARPTGALAPRPTGACDGARTVEHGAGCVRCS